MDCGDTESLRTLHVFLASPGGLEAERSRVRSLVETLNLSFRRIGWRVELLRWEDIGPTAGRPQAEINRDVDRAHVFCGILSDRWGTPTGESSSGFAEEWERSLERYRRSGAPELWLFFKDATSPEQAAFDPQLRAVNEFRESIEREESAFHRSFTGPDDLSGLVQRVLLDLVHRQAGMAAAAGLPNLDWGVALAGEPVLLLFDGQARESLAAELTESEPGRAAEIFLELASELEELGFPSPADVLRRRAASALSAADRVEEALALWRRALSEALVGSHPVETDFAVRELRKVLPPERSWEAKAWGACVSWTEDPEGARRDLRDGLGRGIDGGLDPATAVVWREAAYGSSTSTTAIRRHFSLKRRPRTRDRPSSSCSSPRPAHGRTRRTSGHIGPSFAGVRPCPATAIWTTRL